MACDRRRLACVVLVLAGCAGAEPAAPPPAPARPPAPDELRLPADAPPRLGVLLDEHLRQLRAAWRAGPPVDDTVPAELAELLVTAPLDVWEAAWEQPLLREGLRTLVSQRRLRRCVPFLLSRIGDDGGDDDHALVLTADGVLRGAATRTTWGWRELSRDERAHWVEALRVRATGPGRIQDGVEATVALDAQNEVSVRELVDAFAERFECWSELDPLVSELRLRFHAPPGQLRWDLVKLLLDLNDVVVVEKEEGWAFSAHLRHPSFPPLVRPVVTALFRLRHGRGLPILATLRPFGGESAHARHTRRTALLTPDDVLVVVDGAAGLPLVVRVVELLDVPGSLPELHPEELLDPADAGGPR